MIDHRRDSPQIVDDTYVQKRARPASGTVCACLPVGPLFAVLLLCRAAYSTILRVLYVALRSLPTGLRGVAAVDADRGYYEYVAYYATPTTSRASYLSIYYTILTRCSTSTHIVTIIFNILQILISINAFHEY